MTVPVVGVIGNHYLLDDSYPVHAAGTMNSGAIADVAQAMPLIVPTSPEYVEIERLAEICDGFLFTGGRPNIHPEEYGEEATTAHGAFDRDRDQIVLPLIRLCVEKGQPILGVCRGFQEFNVAYGGSLHPEIRDLAGRMNHRMPPDGTLDEKFALRHAVTFRKGSIFSDILGTDEVMVNSLHGQGIKSAGSRIVVEGTATDGTEEALRISGAQGFALAVQWHPEYRAAEDPVSRPIFAAFGEALCAWQGRQND
ncbi:MAG: gamma-glutamyl-gamma-aminobutyrate hydrolase family protein [Rhodobacteraceae bacterium]|nr:gamma-glutamyl-gamma-aminobutyrate hydrolase family protein [Paracoccaceae bacterium]MCY4197615.1 gamma-glutamyl-gamma-aminobutyrate hydrolase family protein [Paracoccaceae bacterium]